jgi:cupin 2 domain-containing protein
MTVHNRRELDVTRAKRHREMNQKILLGRYRHHKGNEYTALGVARHSETMEELVIYRQEYGDHGLWVRPKQMFLETVQTAGENMPRFEYIGPVGDNSQPNFSNLFVDLPLRLPDELIQTLVTAPSIRIERIVSHGHCSPAGFWYDQDQHEWVAVLAGAAKLRFEENEVVDMKPGDFVNIPAHRKHRVEWTTPSQPTIWLTVHYGAS